MSPLLSQYLLLGVLTLGAGLLFLWSDHGSATSRALAACLILIAVSLLQAPFVGSAGWLHVSGGVTETLAILAGMEWVRRVGTTARDRPRRVARALVRAAQILVLVFGLMQLGYQWIAPEAARGAGEGLIAVRGYEWAIFAPVLGTAALLAGIAIVILLIARTDPAESIRLRAMVFAAPLLFGGIVVGTAWVPLVVMLGLMVFLAGTVRYLIVQAQRAQTLDRFLSPEVARLVKLKGLDEVLRQDRRRISVVVCDLRGFSRFARIRDSAAVVALLERYYNVVGEVAIRHGGTVKDHAGDGVLILVGAPVAHHDHAGRAARLALELSGAVRALLVDADPPLGIGVGVAGGEVTVGAIRGSGRLEYVAVGAAVNLAARLCEQAVDGEVLVDAAVHDAVSPELASSPRATGALKGFETQPVFALQPA